MEEPEDTKGCVRKIIMRFDLFELDKSQCIGNGNYGSVYIGELYDGNNKVAVKRIETNRATERETDALIKLNHHPNVVKFFCMAKDDDFR